MAISAKPVEFNKEEIFKFMPVIVTGAAIIFTIFGLIKPQATKFFSLSKELSDKKNALFLAEQGSRNFQVSKKEIAELEKKVAQLEKRLPDQIEATLLIDTLKDITEETKLKFSSIEPMALKNYELKGRDEFYMELPIKVRLSCTFFEVLKFIEKIENSPRLMKVTEISIRNDPQNIWEHNVELTISTFATGKK